MNNTENTDNNRFFNNIMIVGHAGSDAEIKYFDSGSAKANVSLAVNRIGKNKEKITDWFRVEFWNKDAEIASEYIKKGTLIGVDGRLSVNKWTDKESGEKRELYSIVANSFRLLSSRKANEA